MQTIVVKLAVDPKFLEDRHPILCVPNQFGKFESGGRRWDITGYGIPDRKAKRIARTYGRPVVVDDPDVRPLTYSIGLRIPGINP